MKLKNWKHYAAVLFMALGTMACSSDEEQEAVNLAQEIAGVYNGYTSSSFAYSSTPTVTPKEVLTLTDKGDSKVDVTLSSSTWGEYKLTDVPMTVDGGLYSVAGSGTVTMGGHDGNGGKEYPFDMQGTVEAGGQHPLFEVKLSIMGGTTITFCEGDAPVAQVVAGSYKGTVTLSVNGQEAGSEDNKTVAIRANEEGTATIVLPAFAEGERMSLPSIELSGVTVETADYETYTLLEAPIDVTVGSVHYVGSMTGTIVGGQLDLTYTCTPIGMANMGMTISAKFRSAE